jgi:hypothetical protein
MKTVYGAQIAESGLVLNPIFTDLFIGYITTISFDSNVYTSVVE